MSGGHVFALIVAAIVLAGFAAVLCVVVWGIETAFAAQLDHDLPPDRLK